MNTGALSFLTSLDIPSKPGLSADGSPETAAESGAFDGFADLLDQLVQIAPVTVQLKASGGEPGGQPAGKRQEPDEGGKETGKILPVLPDALPGLGLVVRPDMSAAPILAPIAPMTTAPVAGEPEAQPATARVVDLPVGRLETARIATANAAEGASAIGEGLPATGSGLSADTARTLAPPLAQPMPASILPFAKPVVDTAAPAGSTVEGAPKGHAASAPAQVSAPLLGGASISSITLGAQPSVGGSVASAPVQGPAQVLVQVTVPAATPIAAPTRPVANDAGAQAAPAADKPPVTASDTASRILATVAPKSMQITREAAMVPHGTPVAAQVKNSEAKSGPAIQTGPGALVAAGKTETVAETVRPVEAVQATPRIAAAPETARPAEPVLAATASAPAAASQISGDIVTRAADLARPDAFAAVDSIARMVDRLSAARDFGAMPAAAIAVMHKEFGELSIAIDRVSDALQVEVTAKDGEAQRALAAALANERAAALAGDRTGQRPDAQQAQSATTHASGHAAGHSATQSDRGQGDRGQADRGAGDLSGQNAANTAQSQREGNRDAQRQDRARPDGQPLHVRSASAADRQPVGDDGRYA